MDLRLPQSPLLTSLQCSAMIQWAQRKEPLYCFLSPLCFLQNYTQILMEDKGLSGGEFHNRLGAPHFGVQLSQGSASVVRSFLLCVLMTRGTSGPHSCYNDISGSSVPFKVTLNLLFFRLNSRSTHSSGVLSARLLNSPALL